MTKILHLLTSSSFSGAEAVAIDIINLTADKYTVAYSSPKGGIENQLDENGITYFPIKKINFSEINQVVKKFNPDVIHAHDFKASLFAVLFSRKCKIISHIHQNPDWFSKFNLKTIVYLIASLFYTNIVFVSEKVLKNFKFSKYIFRKSTVIYNAVDIEKIRMLGNQSVSDNYDLAYVGRLTAVKNPLLFLKMVSNLHVRAVMVGDGPLKDIIYNKISELNLNVDVSMVGFSKNPYKYLKHSKICVIPSRNEGFSLVAVEAGVLGIPVIGNATGGLSEVLKKIGGIAVKNEKDMEQAIEELLDDNDSYFKISKKEQENVQNEFNNQLFEMKILKLYQDC